MTTARTRGPWTSAGTRILAAAPHGKAGTERIAGTSYDCVARTAGPGAQSNARLIAAAPELLAELIRLKTELGALANELHNTTGPVTAGDMKAAGAEIMRIFGPAIATTIAKAEGSTT